MQKATYRAAAVLLALFTCSAQAAELVVSAAASLTNAFREAGQAFEARQPGTKVLFNFAASDVLVQQILKGAPVDLFASADQEAMDKAQPAIVPASRRNFAVNALVAIVPAGSKLQPKTLAELQQPGVQRVAIGNPASVPVGRYTKHALEAQKLWPAFEAKAVLAQNVRQALDYVARGEVDAGFVYATDAALQPDKVRVAFTVPLDVAIAYPLALVSGSPQPALAQRFAEFLQSADGQAILARYGFRQP